jgi:multiple sugar transport system permease protein
VFTTRGAPNQDAEAGYSPKAARGSRPPASDNGHAKRGFQAHQKGPGERRMVGSASGMSTAQLRPGGGLERWAERHLRVLMLAPTVIILLGLTIFPSIYMFYAAVHKISPNPDVPWDFVGPGNFVRLLSDQQFHVALLNTTVFTVLAVTVEFLLGLGLALLLDKYIRRLTFLKTMLMIPMMLPPIAVAITWKLIYEPQFGVLNEIMYRLGLPLQAWAGDVDRRRCLAMDAVHLPADAGGAGQPAG